MESQIFPARAVAKECQNVIIVFWGRETKGKGSPKFLGFEVITHAGRLVGEGHTGILFRSYCFH